MFFVIETDPFISSLLIYIFTVALNLGLAFFITLIGKGMQFVRPLYKRIISLISFFSGLTYITFQLINNPTGLSDQSDQMGITIGISILINIILKIIVIRLTKSEQIYALKKLERGIKLLEIKNLKVYYPIYGGMLKRVTGYIKAVDDVSFDISSGETIGLVGESGCGKTTIANFILGLVPKKEGSMLFHGKPMEDSNKYTKFFGKKYKLYFKIPMHLLIQGKKLWI